MYYEKLMFLIILVDGHFRYRAKNSVLAIACSWLCMQNYNNDWIKIVLAKQIKNSSARYKDWYDLHFEN